MTDTATGARFSRRTLLKGTGAVGAGVMLAHTTLLQEAAAQSESIQDILNITVTTEAFGVTLLGEVINSARNGGFSAKPIPEPVLAILAAARAQEQAHLAFFQGAGGQLLTDVFTLPDPKLLTDYDLFFTALVRQEAAEVAAQLAAFRTFTEQNRPDLIKASFQYAAEEAEHRLLANYALGVRPANNVAFAPMLYSSVNEHLAFLRSQGIIGGSGPAITYPGPTDLDNPNVIERTPGGSAVSCTVAQTTSTPQTPQTLPATGESNGSLGAALTAVGVVSLSAGALLSFRAKRMNANRKPPAT